MIEELFVSISSIISLVVIALCIKNYRKVKGVLWIQFSLLSLFALIAKLTFLLSLYFNFNPIDYCEIIFMVLSYTALAISIKVYFSKKPPVI